MATTSTTTKPKTGMFSLNAGSIPALNVPNMSASVTSPGGSSTPKSTVQTIGGYKPIEQPKFNNVAKLNTPTAPVQQNANVGVRPVSPTDKIQPPSNVLASKDVVSPSKVAGFTRKGNDVYDAQGNYVSYEQAQKMGIVPLLAGIPQGQQSATSGQNMPKAQSSSQNQPQVPKAQGAPEGMTYDGQGKLVPIPAKTDTTSGYNPTYGGIIGQMINSAQGVNPMTQQGMGAYQKSVDDLANFRRMASQKIGNEEAQGIPLEFVQGRQQVLQRQAAEQENTLQSAVNQQQQAIGFGQAQQGLQQSGLNSAAGFTQPVSQFGMLTNPLTGTPLNTGVFQNAVQTALSMVRAGTPANDPAVTSLLSSFGFVGPLAFNNAMQSMQGGGWNPAAQSTQAQTNLNQGAQFQQEATQLSTVLNQMNAVSGLADSFLANSGLNQQGSPFFNKQQNTLLGQLKNPANAATYNELVNNIKTYSAQILGSSGLNPTDVGEMVDSINPDGMTAPQLKEFLHNIDQLGQARLKELQQTSQNSYGTGGGFSGTPASVGQLNVGPDTGYNIPQNPAMQTLLGGLANFGGNVIGIGTAIKGLLKLGQ